MELTIKNDGAALWIKSDGNGFTIERQPTETIAAPQQPSTDQFKDGVRLTLDMLISHCVAYRNSFITVDELKIMSIFGVQATPGRFTISGDTIAPNETVRYECRVDLGGEWGHWTECSELEYKDAQTHKSLGGIPAQSRIVGAAAKPIDDGSGWQYRHMRDARHGDAWPEYRFNARREPFTYLVDNPGVPFGLDIAQEKTPNAFPVWRDTPPLERQPYCWARDQGAPFVTELCQPTDLGAFPLYRLEEPR